MKVKIFPYKFVDDFSDRRGYRLAGEFDLDEFDGEKDHYAALEHVFEQLNVGGDLIPATDWCKEYRAAGNASLSVEDIVVLGDKPWYCASAGWLPLDESWEPGDDSWESDGKGGWKLSQPFPAGAWRWKKVS